MPRPNTHQVSSRRAANKIRPLRTDSVGLIHLTTTRRLLSVYDFTRVRLRLLPSTTQGTAVYRGEVPWTQEAPVHAVFKDEKNFDAVSPGKDEGDFRCVGRKACVSVVCCTTCVIRAMCDTSVVTWSSMYQLGASPTVCTQYDSATGSAPLPARRSSHYTRYGTLPHVPVHQRLSFHDTG